MGDGRCGSNLRAFLAAGTKANGTVYTADEASGVNITRHFRKIQAYTGANLDYSEHLQVANYGLGGHYLPHHDHVTVRPSLFSPFTTALTGEGQPITQADRLKSDVGLYNRVTGNRLATLLSYFTTPLAGGATIFPNLDVYAPAVKGPASSFP